MQSKTLKCVVCGTKRPKEEMYKPRERKLQYVCKKAIKLECTAKFGLKLAAEDKKKEEKAFRAETRRRKLAAKGRLDYYKDLGTLVNQYFKHVHAKGEPCYTCGKTQKLTDGPHMFHAGHYKPAKRTDPRRFMLENVRMQCYSCNSANSGRGAEYRKRLVNEKGVEFVEWLECDANHKNLKEQFQEIDDIKNEISRYRKLLRENGLTPISRG